MTVRILAGHCLDVLATLPEASVHCAITSPPYYGLRAYGTEPQVWGGDGSCGDGEHEWGDPLPANRQEERRTPEEISRHSTLGPKRDGLSPDNAAFVVKTTLQPKAGGAFCLRCHAWRGELGQEPTVDCFGWATGNRCGACYICHLVDVFRAVKRVLRPDGCLFVNISDSYSAHPGQRKIGDKAGPKQMTNAGSPGSPSRHDPNIPAKNLMLAPESLRFAMRADGWWVRSKMPWVKRAAMPESCNDRPSTSVEDVILFTRSPRYFWDPIAVKRANTGHDQGTKGVGPWNKSFTHPGDDVVHRNQNGKGASSLHSLPETGRNLRNGDLFFDSLGLILDGTGGDEPESEPQPKTRKTDKQGDSGLRRYAGFNDRWDASGEPDANAGPPFPPQGLILDEAGDPLALDVNPAGYAGAHFATFPPKLVRPLILAGTSEKGCCPGCGAPWVRVVEKGDFTPSNGRGGAVHAKSYGQRMHGLDDLAAAPGEAGNGFGSYARQTTGWSPSCKCGTTETRPCKVLDIFGGSGTTGLVADQLGRDAILIDLQPDYVAMGLSRITNDAPLFAAVEVER